MKENKKKRNWKKRCNYNQLEINIACKWFSCILKKIANYTLFCAISKLKMYELKASKRKKSLKDRNKNHKTKS